MHATTQELAERVRWEVIWILTVLAVTAAVPPPLGLRGLLWEIARNEPAADDLVRG